MSSAYNKTITIKQGEKWALERKAKQGWRCFFIMRDNYDDLTGFVRELQNRNRDMREQLRNGENVDIEYLKTQFIEMYDKLKEYTECPVCYELLTKNAVILYVRPV